MLRLNSSISGSCLSLRVSSYIDFGAKSVFESEVAGSVGRVKTTKSRLVDEVWPFSNDKATFQIYFIVKSNRPKILANSQQPQNY